MIWLFKTYNSSVGKKLVMALTGLGFCAFLVVHLIGNLTLFGGAEYFEAYVTKLHTLGPVIPVVNFALLVLGTVHVITGVLLFRENLIARPVRYKVKKNAGGRTIGSATMPYTGFFLLFFLAFHLLDFHFADKSGTTLHQIMVTVFSSPINIIFYTAATILTGVHASHGFWSAFQTMGINHTKYTPAIKGLAIAFSLVMAVGFGTLPFLLAA